MYVYVWEFVVRPGRETEFERFFGADGEWVKLFQRAGGFISTELDRDARDPRRYITIDYWESPESYEKFRRDFADEWQAIDDRGGQLTEEENHLGAFICVSRARSSRPV
jgi:heme-degrading monooxygenase HmoA